MRNEFKGYYRPTEQELAELWKQGLFVLDANVILGLYCYPIQARDDLLQTLWQVSDRLWIPHQAALEYQENRLSVIAEQVSKFADVNNVLLETRETLTNKLNELQLKKRHSAINPESFLQRTEVVFNDFESELNSLRERQPTISDDDKIREDIDALLEGKIGSPLSSDELTALYNAGKDRFEHQRPPGYLDKGKSKQDEKYYFYNDLEIQREYGDLIIWNQIIREAKAHNIKCLIFITDDEKEDWWWIYKGKTVGPRPELVEEIHTQAGVTLFYMYNSPRFLKYAKEYLGAQIDQESINQVHEISQLRKEESRRHSLHADEMELLDAVHNWLSLIKHPQSRIGFGQSYPDFLVEEETERIGYEVKRLYNANMFRKHLSNWEGQGLLEIERRNLSRINYLLVVNSEEEAQKVLVVLGRHRAVSPDVLKFMVGVISTYPEMQDLPIFKPINFRAG